MLRRRIGAGVTALLVVVLLAISDASPARAVDCSGSTTVPQNRAERRVALRATLCLVNRERAATGLSPVRSSRQLTRAARHHSFDMVARRYFDHDGPAGDTLATRVRGSGFMAKHPGATVQEALVWGSPASPEMLVQAMLASPPHREIMLNPRARRLGLGMTLGAPLDGVAGPSATLVLEFGDS